MSVQTFGLAKKGEHRAEEYLKTLSLGGGGSQVDRVGKVDQSTTHVKTKRGRQNAQTST